MICGRRYRRETAMMKTDAFSKTRGQKVGYAQEWHPVGRYVGPYMFHTL